MVWLCMKDGSDDYLRGDQRSSKKSDCYSCKWTLIRLSPFAFLTSFLQSPQNKVDELQLVHKFRNPLFFLFVVCVSPHSLQKLSLPDHPASLFLLPIPIFIFSIRQQRRRAEVQSRRLAGAGEDKATEMALLIEEYQNYPGFDGPFTGVSSVHSLRAQRTQHKHF